MWLLCLFLPLPNPSSELLWSEPQVNYLSCIFIALHNNVDWAMIMKNSPCLGWASSFKQHVLLCLLTVLICCLLHPSSTCLISFNHSFTVPLPFFPHLPHQPLSHTILSSDNTASIVSRRHDGFSQDRDQEFFSLVLVVADGGEPPLSSTTTLSLRVCVCQRNTRGRNSNNVCQAQAFLSSAGLSTGAFVAILLCIVILLGKYKSTNDIHMSLCVELLCHWNQKQRQLIRKL